MLQFVLILAAWIPSTLQLSLKDSIQYNLFQSDDLFRETKVRIVGVKAGGRAGEEKSQCYVSGLKTEATLPEIEQQPNSFLDVLNLIDFARMSSKPSSTIDDAIKFYNVSIAAMERGNQFLAQENLARAISAINNVKRKKRDVSMSAEDLMERFKKKMGTEKFREMLHIDRRVTMAFVIDTSSSMVDDITKVIEYIRRIVYEQAKAKTGRATYIVTTFADPYVEDARVFNNKRELYRYLDTFVPVLGGDCEERTCHGMLNVIGQTAFNNYGNAAMFVFTDAGSKDCMYTGMKNTIIEILRYYKASAYFILFDSCKPNIDASYVQMAKESGGFVLFMRGNSVYNITDAVNGAFDSDALIFGEQSENINSVVGQGRGAYRKKRTVIVPGSNDMGDIEGMGYSPNPYYRVSKSIWVDTSMEAFTLTIRATPSESLLGFELVPPEDHRCNMKFISITDNFAEDSRTIKVVFKDCPCTGEWKLLGHGPTAETYSYSLRSSGEYVVAFDAYFVDETDSQEVANYAPCLGKEEYLVVNMLQGEKVKLDTLQAKIVGVAGNEIHWQGQLSESHLGGNKFAAKVNIPKGVGEDGFRIMLEGQIIDGSRFQRISYRYFYPTTSCLRVLDVTNYYTITPSSKTYIEMELSNNGDVKEGYNIVCSNNKEYSTMVGGKSNPVYLKPGQSTKVKGYISGPRRGIKHGALVIVTCTATSPTSQLIENIRLVELDKDLDCVKTKRNRYRC